MLVFVFLAFVLIYYFAPDLHEQQLRWLTPGAAVGVILWLFVSFLFGSYLNFYNTYSVVYGSLGAVIILLLWFYLTGVTILIGGEVNAIIEQAAARAGDPEAKAPGEKFQMKARGYARQECNHRKMLQQERTIHISVSEVLRSRGLLLEA